MEKMKLDLLGITETKKKGVGISKLPKDYVLYRAGVKENERARGGVGLIVHPNRVKNITK